MTKTKTRKLTKQKEKTTSSGLPMIVVALIAGGLLLGYLAGEIVFYARSHPVHWATALMFGLLGYIVGLVIYRKYGDIV